MKLHTIAMLLTVVACLVMHTGNARSLNQTLLSPEKRNISFPFLIYVPDNSPPLTSPEGSQTIKNSGKTMVEIIRSVEIKLNGSDKSNFRRPSSDIGDLLFSDIDFKKRGNEISGQRGGRKNERDTRKLSDILSLTSRETKNKYQESSAKSSSKSVLAKSLADDGLDFNSRILLGSILIRNYNNELQDNDKYSYFSDPKVSDNTYHATYINRNSSTEFNKSRINVKFPPKLFPLKNANAHHNGPNKTSIVNNSISLSQRALYRSRIGKQIKVKANSTQVQITESNYKQKPSKVTPATNSQTQHKMENLQGLTHWDFGKKTAHTQGNEGNNIPNSGLSTTPSVQQNDNVLASNVTYLIHPKKSTFHPLEETTPKSARENEIERPVGPQAIVRNTFPQHQSVPIYSNTNNIQNLPFLSDLYIIKSPQHYHSMHADSINAIRQNLGPHLFPNTHVQDKSNRIRSGSFEEGNTKTYRSQATVHKYIPVVNVGQQSEQQYRERNNWQPVYFVPHVAYQQQHQPTLINLQAVNTRGATQTIPIILQQNSHLYQPALFGPNHAGPTHNGIVYEGKSLIYSIICWRYKKFLVSNFLGFSLISVPTCIYIYERERERERKSLFYLTTLGCYFLYARL